MEDKNLMHRDVPYLIYEATQARNERTIKRLIVVVIISIALMFITNAMWLYVWNQYDYEEMGTSVDVDAGYGTANYIGNDGDINNGENNSDDMEKNENAQTR